MRMLVTVHSSLPRYPGLRALAGLSLALGLWVGVAEAQQATVAPATSSASPAPAARVKPSSSAVFYNKPVKHGDHYYTWHGAWRDRQKGKKATAAAEPAQHKKPIIADASAGLDQLSIVADPRIASDLAAVVNDGGLKLVPAITKNLPSNVQEFSNADYDLAILPTDVFAAMRQDDSKSTLTYIARLYTAEFHIVAAASITDLSQLAGKRVATDGARLSAKLVFEKLGLSAEFSQSELSTPLERLQRGEVDAAILVSGRTIAALATFDPAGKYHLLSVPYSAPLEGQYYPARLTNQDYPSLIGQGDAVDTIAVGTVLAAVDATAGSQRFRKLSHFTNTFFTRFDALLKPSRHPKWREVNLAAKLPELSRFRAAQDWLAKPGPDNGANLPRPGPVKLGTNVSAYQPVSFYQPMSMWEQEQLFARFLNWRRAPSK
jgi:TRAP-type uncharacterized transport system substrate-binding protein